MTIKEMKKKLSDMLSSERYIHSLGVMDMAICLAKTFGADPEKAAVAGLLHDCAKELTGSEREALLQTCKERIDPMMLREKGLWHAPLGAELAAMDFEACDADIYDAIYYHTVGKPQMSLLTKVIYVADMVECGRDCEYPWVAGVRAQTLRELDAGILITIDFTLKSLIERGLTIHPLTIAARNELIEQKRSAKIT